MKISPIPTLLLLLIAVSNVSADPEQFSLREAWNLDIWGSFFNTHKYNFNGDNIDELYFTTNIRLNNNRKSYETGIIENGRVGLTHTAPGESDVSNGFFLSAGDFNGDGYGDIVIQEYRSDKIAIFNGKSDSEDDEIIYRGTDLFGNDGYIEGKVGKDDNGEIKPLLLHDTYYTVRWDNERGGTDRYDCITAVLRTGSNLEDSYDSLAHVGFWGSFAIYENSENRSDYFIAGKELKFYSTEEFGSVDSLFITLTTHPQQSDTHYHI